MTIVLIECVLKDLCQQLKLCMPHRPAFDNHLTSLGHTIFRDNCVDGICLENRCQQLCILTTGPDGALPQRDSCPFLRSPVCPQCPRFRLAPSQRSSPQAISHIFLSVHNVHASISLPPMVQRSSLKAISYDLLSVHNVRASVSLRQNGALPKLFPTVSCPSTKSTLPSRSLPTPLTDLSPGYPHCFLSTLPSRSLPTKLSPSYFPLLGQSGNLWRGHLLVPRRV